jgi:hypothetical protein
MITFSAPDDGGRPIIGYHVHAQRQDDQTNTEWALLGDLNATLQRQPIGSSTAAAAHEMKVNDLLPGTTYRLKLVAFNELGDSTTPTLSPPFTTKKGAANERGQGSPSEHIKGIGHPDRGQNDKSYVQTSDVITLNDNAQKVIAGNQTLNVWTCHWSPRSFQLSAEAVWADPPMVESAIANAGLIKGRIAFVRRGDVPFVTKAMAVQVMS